MPDLSADRVDPRSLSIIVADDESSMASLVRDILEGWFEKPVEAVPDGDTLLSAVASGRFRAVVTDMNMPGLCGIELVRALRLAQPDIGIIVMTGFIQQFPYVDVIKAGADDFISKPFAKEELRAKLERLFREQDVRHRHQRAEEKYRSLFQMSHEGMLVLDANSLIIEDANDAFAKLSGRSFSGLVGTPFLDFFSTNVQMRMQAWLGACAHIGQGTLADVVLGESTSPCHSDITATFISAGSDRLIYLLFKDVTEKREVEAQLADAAQKDELTGLFNKRTYHSRLDGALQRAAQGDQRVALLLIDLDNFKRCNDTYGHQIGDKLLISVGDAIHASIRKADMGFRCGGDEFSVMLFDSTDEGVMRVAKKMQEEFAKVESYGTTMSIGIATFDRARDVGSETLIRRADEALYRAKRAGKNTVEMAV